MILAGFGKEVYYKNEGKFEMAKLTLVDKDTEYPTRLSPVAMTFEAEIKRTAIEKGLEIGEVIAKLAKLADVAERQLYNYRSGKTDIPAMLIPQFCKQFGSNALAMAIVTMCNGTEFEERDAFDLAKFASQSVQDTLKGHDEFLDAFDDGTIDGHELAKLSHSTAKIIRNAHRLNEIARRAHERTAA